MQVIYWGTLGWKKIFCPGFDPLVTRAQARRGRTRPNQADESLIRLKTVQLGIGIEKRPRTIRRLSEMEGANSPKYHW